MPMDEVCPSIIIIIIETTDCKNLGLILDLLRKLELKVPPPSNLLLKYLAKSKLRPRTLELGVAKPLNTPLPICFTVPILIVVGQTL